MKIRNTSCCIFVCSLGLLAIPSQAQPDPGIPHFAKQGTATQLIVDGKPFVVLTGETEEETSTSFDNMRPVWPTLIQMNLNTVLPVVYWGLFEPEEGKYDFTLVDGPHPGRQEPQSARRSGVVRKLEERFVHLRSRVGEKGLQALSARADQERYESGDLLLHRGLRRCHAGRGCARLCRPDAARQGSGRPAAHRHHGPGGERSGNGGGFPRPLAGGRQGLRRGRCRRS